MKRNVLKIVVACCAVGSVALANMAFAGSYLPVPPGSEVKQSQNLGPNNRDGKDKKDKKAVKESKSQPRSVPELDAAGAPITLALIGGIAGLALERRRSRKAS